MSVAVVGGGYAGMAAAVTLADAGIPVTVYEAGAQLGGRARRVVVNGIALDNGLHILIGAYHELLRLVRKVHPDPDQAFLRHAFEWRVHGRFHLKALPLPAPLHIGAGLLTARGAPWRERIAAARFVASMRNRAFRLAPDTTVSELLGANGQGEALVRYLWTPLTLAALNTPLKRASAQTLLHVLERALFGSRSDSDILLVRSDLSLLFPAPAATYVRARGGEVLTALRVETLEERGDAVVVRTRASSAQYDHVICAVSAHNAPALLSEFEALAATGALLQRLRYQPIYSIYLQFEDAVRLPAPMLGLPGTAQWVFDREAICGQRGSIGAVISAEGPHQNVDQDALAARVHREIEREFGPLPPLAWHRVIAEKRATFECAVGTERPSTRTPLRNVHLAGDYTAGDFPATLEAAVRSGIAAARQVIETGASNSTVRSRL